MTYSVTGYRSRAEECVRLANATKDEMLRAAILGLRQQYLHIARRLGEMDIPPRRPDANMDTESAVSPKDA